MYCKAKKEKMKTYRVYEGSLYEWETGKDGEDTILRIRKVFDLYGKPTISDFAEKLVENILKENKKVVINLR